MISMEQLMTMEFTIRTELREVASSETIRVDEQAKGVHDAADYRSEWYVKRHV